MKLKHAFCSIVMSVLMMQSMAAEAATHTATATVQYISVIDSTFDATSTSSYFALNGVASLGTCGAAGGRVIFHLRDDARGESMKSMLTAALLSGKSVTVTVDDATLLDPTTGQCMARSVRLVG